MIVVVVVGGIAGVVAVRDAAYANDALPGVAVREVDTDRDRLVSVEGKKLPGGGGVLAVDVPATRAAALAAGRDSLWTRVRQLVVPSPPEIVVDPVLRPTAAADELLAELERRAKLTRPAAAQIGMRGRTPQVTPARPGRTIDRDAFLSLLSRAVVDGAADVEAPLAASRPELDTAAAEEAAATARQIISAPVALTFDGQEVGSLTPSRLARLLHFAPRRDHFVVSFDRERLADAVRPALRPWRTRAANARFLVGAKSVQIAPSKPGLDVNPKVALAQVTAAAYSDLRVAELALQETRPDLTTREADKLGIREQISSFTTDMGVSSSNRIHNVQLMAQYIDGTLLRPGDDLLLQRLGRPAHERARLPRGADDHRLAAPALDRRRRLPDRDDALQQRLGARPADRGAAQPQLLHLPLSDGARRHGLLGRARLRLQERPEDRDPDQDELHGLDAHVQLLGHESKRKVVSTTGPQSNWRSPETTYALDPYAPRGSVRTVSGSNQMGFDVTVSRTVDSTEGGALGLGHEQLHRRRPDGDLRPRPHDPRARTSSCRGCKRYSASCLAGAAGLVELRSS